MIAILMIKRTMEIFNEPKSSHPQFMSYCKVGTVSSSKNIVFVNILRYKFNANKVKIISRY